MTGMQHLTLRQLKTALEEAAQEGFVLFPESRKKRNWTKLQESVLFSKVYKEICDHAENGLTSNTATLPFSQFIRFGEDGNRNGFESVYFERRKRLSAFVLLFLTEGKERWGQALEDLIWAICEETTWVIPAHVGLYVNEYPYGIWDQSTAPRETVDLFSSITAFALAEIISLVGEELHPWVVERVHKELDRRILQVYFYDPVPQNWEQKKNNWPAVCASGIGVTAIYEVADSEVLAGMLWRVVAAMRNHLSGFDEEGATAEGITYWQFGFGFYVYFAELLRDRTGGRIDLLADQQIAQIASLPNFCILSEGKTVNFSDSVEQIPINIGLISRLSSRCKTVDVPYVVPVYNDLFDHWAHFARILLWTPEQIVEENQTARINYEDKCFKGHQWVISKNWTPSGLYAFAAKGGHNAEPHNHNDLGHFIVHAKGKTILEDIGSGFYTREYFDPSVRYSLLAAGSHGHSVPIINDKQQATGEQAQSMLLEYTHSQDQLKFKLDLTRAYEGALLQKFERSFIWQRHSLEKECFELTIEDHVVTEHNQVPFIGVYITTIKPQFIAPGQIQLDEAQLYYEDQSFSFDYEEHDVKLLYGNVKTIYRILLTWRNKQPNVSHSRGIIHSQVKLSLSK